MIWMDSHCRMDAPHPGKPWFFDHGTFKTLFKTMSHIKTKHVKIPVPWEHLNQDTMDCPITYGWGGSALGQKKAENLTWAWAMLQGQGGWSSAGEVGGAKIAGRSWKKWWRKLAKFRNTTVLEHRKLGKLHQRRFHRLIISFSATHVGNFNL